jgi:hypothetical protein
MKIKRGGGGVNKDGNSYKLPETEIEVPDDYFEKAMTAFSNIPAPEFMIVHPEVFDMLTRNQKRRRR